MNSRRLFFKQFIGQVGVLRDDLRGVENIPLNRLCELPDEIIDEIEPIFFPEEKWNKIENSICLLNSINNENERISLSSEEEFAFNFFIENISLKEVSDKLHNAFEIQLNEAREICTSLFFLLASNRICHPREIYKIDELK